MKRSEKVSKVSGLGGCLPSLVLFMTGFSTSISWNLAAAFLSLGFGVLGVIGLITARGIAKDENNGNND